MTKEQLIELVKFTAGEIIAPTELSTEVAESIVDDFVDVEQLNIHIVVGKNEPSDCAHDWQSVFHHNNLIGRYCPNCEQLRAG